MKQTTDQELERLHLLARAMEILKKAERNNSQLIVGTVTDTNGNEQAYHITVINRT